MQVTSEMLARAYWSTKRTPKEGTLADAIKMHAQACGVVSYIYDVHPDVVAGAVKELSNYAAESVSSDHGRGPSPP